MNKLQCTEDFYVKQQLKVVPSHYSLIRCLRDMGHVVEQRVVNIGENLDEYDKIIVYIHNPGGFAAYIYNALYVINQRPNCILAFDDWQTDSIYAGLISLKEPEKLFRKYVLDGHDQIVENIFDYEEQFIDAINIIESKNNRLLISAFAGGDPTLLLDYPRELIYTYNPNPYHLNRQPNISTLFPEPKDRVFNFAGLIQDKTRKWLKDQKIDGRWPIMKYGSRKDGQDRVTEDVMVNIYSKQWGILMPGYFHAGSGWWRARPLQVADAGSILIGDYKEMMIYYGDNELSKIKSCDLIDMSDNQLTNLAHEQKAALYKLHPLNKGTQKKELDLCLNY